MLKKLFCLLLIIKLTQASYSPKYYGQESTKTVDNVGINYQNRIRFPPRFPLWRYYPRYRILPPPPPAHIWSINNWLKAKNIKPIITPSTTSPTSTSTTTTTTTTTTTPKPITFSTTSLPFLTDDEFPQELLEIAQNKLGLKSLDEIPSISELGQLLGTNSPQETLHFIEKLTRNDQGIALMKAYIESADYTDSSALVGMDDIAVVITNENSNNDYEINDENNETEESTTYKTTNTLKNLQKFKEKPKAYQSFMERIASFMNSDNVIETNPLEQQLKVNENNDIENTRVKNVKSISNDALENQTISEKIEDPERNSNKNVNTPILVRESIPYNYPVPIRVSSSTTTTSSPLMNSLNSNKTSTVHLNTPKILIPHVKQISRLTNIPTNKIEDFLSTKPQILELATKVSHFPINYDRNSPVEAQVIAAVQKAIEQDEDLRNLISSASTLN